MVKINNLQGEYKLFKRVLKGNGLKLLIAKRNKTTKTKTPQFLYDISTKQGRYISSLYPLADNVYKLDFQGVEYQLKLDEAESKGFISHVLIS